MFNKILIDQQRLNNNIKQVILSNPNSKVCAMVKANAYGVGTKEVVKTIDEFVDFYGVACFFEYLCVRKFSKKPVLIVGELERQNLNEDVSYSCSCLDDVKFLAEQNRPFKIHLKINTGMNRFGFDDIVEFEKSLEIIQHSNLIFEGLFTHFATGDDYADVQFERFKKYIFMAKSYNFKPIIHADNSIVNENRNHNLDMVRIGYDLFLNDSEKFCPVTKIATKIVQVKMVKRGELVGYDYKFVAKKKMKVAVIPVGYADGFDCKYIGLKLTLNNKKCKVLNVCMDCFMLDITNTNLKKNDTIFLLDDVNNLKLFANYTKTSCYEVMCKFSHLRCERKLISSSSN